MMMIMVVGVRTSSKDDMLSGVGLELSCCRTLFLFFFSGYRATLPLLISCQYPSILDIPESFPDRVGSSMFVVDMTIAM